VTDKGDENGESGTAKALLTYGDLMGMDLPPREPLLGEWFAERDLCMVYGQTGRGKSLVCLSKALAIAGSGAVFGWEAPVARKVLYIDAEMDVLDLQERMRLLWPTIDGGDIAEARRNLIFLSRHHANRMKVGFPDLVEPQGLRVLIDVVKHERPAVVVIDNLSTMADLEDENDAAAVTPVLDTMARLRALNCAVILIHHTGKQEGKYRGSSKLSATCEAVLQLGPHLDMMDGYAAFALSVDKYRRGTPPQPFKASLSVEDGRGRWTLGGEREEKLRQLADAVRTGRYTSQKTLAVALGVSGPEVSKRKKKAIAEGYISEADWKAKLSGKEAS